MVNIGSQRRALTYIRAGKENKSFLQVGRDSIIAIFTMAVTQLSLQQLILAYL